MKEIDMQDFYNSSARHPSIIIVLIYKSNLYELFVILIYNYL